MRARPYPEDMPGTIGIRDESHDLVAALHFVRFTDITATREPLPTRLEEWLRTPDDGGIFERAIENDAHKYWRIFTRQGEFGYLWSGSPILDLHGTGVTPGEIVPELKYVTDLCLMGNTKTLLHLRLALEKLMTRGNEAI